MSNVPTYKAAVVGQPGNAGMVNQFLAAHNSTFVYNSAILRANETTGISTYLSTESQYISQSFMTGSTQTAIGEVWLQVSTVNGSAITDNIDPLTLSLYADSGGEPTGAALAMATLTETVIYDSPFWVIFPLTATGLTVSTTYHLVTSPAGTATSYYVWQENDQPSGASTSPDAIVWTDQAFGMMYQVYDQTAAEGATLRDIVMDSGARVIQYTYNSEGLVQTVTEHTINQVGTGSLNNTRTYTYTNGLLTGIS